MTLDLPELRRLLAEATAGPWRRDGTDVFTQGGEIMEIIEAGDRLVLLPTDAMALTEAEYTPELHAARWAAANASQAVNDAALIVALRNAAPELLAAATLAQARTCGNCGHDRGLHFGPCSVIVFPEGYAGGLDPVHTCGCKPWRAAPELLAAAEERAASSKYLHVAAEERDRLARLIVGYADLTERVATEGRDWREIGDEWSKVLAVARAVLAETPVEPDGDPDYMCPNCLTPWKCNWPHILEPES